jgi:hypothetical protein
VNTTEADGCVVYSASRDGRMRRADGILAVDDIYTIRGEVGLETGNVSHPGATVTDVRVLKRAYMDTVVKIGTATFTVDDPIDTPCTISKIEGQIVVAPSKRLSNPISAPMYELAARPRRKAYRCCRLAGFDTTRRDYVF